MSDALEEIAEQTSARVNERSHRGKFGFAISPSIERASAAREKKKQAHHGQVATIGRAGRCCGSIVYRLRHPD